MTPEALANAARLLLTDHVACRVCGEPIVREKRRGRPPTTHPTCVRKARTDYERKRVRDRADGRTVEEDRQRRDALTACLAADGVTNLGAWTTSPEEVTSATGDALWSTFLPDEWVTLAEDGGAAVGASSDVLTQGAADRAAAPPVRIASRRTPVGRGERRAIVDGIPLILRSSGKNQ